MRILVRDIDSISNELIRDARGMALGKKKKKKNTITTAEDVRERRKRYDRLPSNFKTFENYLYIIILRIIFIFVFTLVH